MNALTVCIFLHSSVCPLVYTWAASISGALGVMLTGTEVSISLTYHLLFLQMDTKKWDC